MSLIQSLPSTPILTKSTYYQTSGKVLLLAKRIYGISILIEFAMHICNGTKQIMDYIPDATTNITTT
jgi:hypothetical protein